MNEKLVAKDARKHGTIAFYKGVEGVRRAFLLISSDGNMVFFYSTCFLYVSCYLFALSNPP